MIILIIILWIDACDKAKHVRNSDSDEHNIQTVLYS